MLAKFSINAKTFSDMNGQIFNSDDLFLGTDRRMCILQRKKRKQTRERYSLQDVRESHTTHMNNQNLPT